jgi:hypothetical protein
MKWIRFLLNSSYNKEQSQKVRLLSLFFYCNQIFITRSMSRIFIVELLIIEFLDIELMIIEEWN